MSKRHYYNIGTFFAVSIIMFFPFLFIFLLMANYESTFLIPIILLSSCVIIVLFLLIVPLKCFAYVRYDDTKIEFRNFRRNVIYFDEIVGIDFTHEPRIAFMTVAPERFVKIKSKHKHISIPYYLFKAEIKDLIKKSGFEMQDPFEDK